MLKDPEGNLGLAIHLRDEVSKGMSGRVIPLNKELRAALQKLHDERSKSRYVITTSAIAANVSERDREPICVVVQGGWIARVLKSFWQTHLHHQRRANDLDGWWFAKRRADALWS
jgi:hypothetical protein